MADAPIAAGFIPSSSYWSYLDVVGNTLKKLTTLAAGLVDVTKVVAPLMLARQPTNSVATTNAAAKPAP